MKVVVVPHDPAWAAAFASEAVALNAALGGAVVALHHIGSTAIPTILAKPIIDILGEATSLDAVDAHAAAVVALGYEARGEFGLPGRRYFSKRTPEGIRTHHLHIFQQGSTSVQRHLAFRDHLRAHPAKAADYAALKARLVADGVGWEGYMDGKDALVKRLEAEAMIWAQALMA
jgi:GrpB-like predicted nucleotidyltransferase (UPF0157 family)